MNPKGLAGTLLVAVIFVLTAACHLGNPAATSSPNILSLPAVTPIAFEGAPRHLAWSPDDSQLLITGAYAEEEQIVILSLITGEIDTIVTVAGGPERNGWLHHADLSPDGSQIVFAKDGPVLDQDALKQGIWVASVATGKTRLLTENGRSPVWSSNGEYIFATSATAILQIDASTGELLASYPVQTKGDLLVGFSLARSADDRLVAVQVGPKAQGGVYSPQNNHIYTVDVKSGDAHLLDAIIGMQPTWSPNGDVLAFIGIQGESDKGLYLVNADGTCLTQVLDIPAAIPAWSHSGSKIAFAYGGRIHLLDVVEAIGEGASQSRLSCQ